jgi:hypothetical protein
MADACWARAHAASQKGYDLTGLGHYARAADKCAQAAAAAQEAGASAHCLILAQLRTEHAGMLLLHAMHSDVSPAEEKAALAAVVAALPAVVVALEARCSAGTLMAPTPQETAWYSAECAHVAVREKGRAVASTPAVRDALEQRAHLLGYETLLRAANVLLSTLLSPVFERVPGAQDAQDAARNAARFALVAAAVTALGAPRTLLRNARLDSEDCFVYQLRAMESVGALADAGAPAAALHAAWLAVERGGELQRRGNDVGVAQLPQVIAQQHAAGAAAAAACGLRACSLAGCGACEVHASQFKLCSACRAAVYCSKAHQAEDWGSHKKACKAARKAAGQIEQ